MSATKSALSLHLLPELKQQFIYFSMDAVRRLLDEKGQEITDGTLRHYMSDAMAQGIVHDAGRGWYSGIKEPCKLDAKPVKKIVKLLEKEFPLLDFVCWSTQQINPWMHHILSKFITFVNVEKDGLSAVADVLRSSGYMVHQNPGKNQANEVVPNGKTVVVRPLVGKAPTEAGHLSPPEAVLVDLFMENKALNIMGKADFHEMLEAVASTSRLSWGSMLYYASEREISLEELVGGHSSLTRE